MSMTEQQVKEIRNYLDTYTVNNGFIEYPMLGWILNQAADTIEALSAKLAAENMELSDRYYGGGWIDFNDKLPKNEEKVLLSKNGETLQDLFEFYFPDENCEDYKDSGVVGFLEGESACYDGFTILKGNKDNMKWQPLPGPYRT